MQKDYFHNKKVLITGNTGFKGVWLTMFLKQLGAKVWGIANREYSNNLTYHSFNLKDEINQHYLDITDYSSLNTTIQKIRPDIVFHLAGQSLTSKAYTTPLQTLQINGMGTANLLECFRNYDDNCDIIIVTSDKCYKNNEWVWGYRENDILEGEDPYSASKSIAEVIFKMYYKTYFEKDSKVQVISCRAGNVIGGGDWSENRIVPDCMRAWSQNKAIEIRSPEAIRPWNYVLDIVYGYALSASLIRSASLNGESFNFGPQTQKELSVLELVDRLSQDWGIPKSLAYKIVSKPEFPENTYLKLNVDKAEHVLHWYNRTNVQQMVSQTIDWYKTFYNDSTHVKLYTENLIKNYLEEI